jgi:hypothetical protein
MDADNQTPAALEWHKGPAEGGTGTAGKDDKGHDLWWDGDCLLVIVETNHGREVSVIHITSDEETFSISDSNGDLWGWDTTDISWWAKLDKRNLPEAPNKEATDAH